MRQGLSERREDVAVGDMGLRPEPTSGGERPGQESALALETTFERLVRLRVSGRIE